MRNLTTEETRVVDLLAEAWSVGEALPVPHEFERDLLCRAIRTAQDIVLARAARDSLTGVPETQLESLPTWDDFLVSLSSRSRNALTAEPAITSFESLTPLTKRDLLGRPRLGPMCFAEIKEALSRFGLSLS